MLTLQIKEKEIENLTPEEEFVRGTVGAKCQINFDEFWQSYNKYIVFKRVGYEPINFMVDTLENEIEIPYTILAESGEFKIGVFGITETETLPTLYSKDIKILYGTDTHGTTPPTYIPSEIYQLRLSKQDKLVSGENIKTVNGESVLGSGNIKIQVEVDQTYTPDSTNAQSGTAVAEAMSNKMDKNNPTGTGSFSLNRKANTAVGNYSFTEGYATEASGSNSHAEGNSTTASGYVSHTEGGSTTALGDYSHAEGYYTTASSSCSHAEGSSTTASGSSSHAEGYYTTASSYASHAEGSSTIASGDRSHAEGYYTTASGYASHAEGSSRASGDRSHAEGFYTKASGDYQHVQGKYNIADTANTYADIIGNGSSDTNRSNAATVDWNGNAWYAGAVTSNGADYAEFFEWLDGNTDNEDRVGYLVALDGEKIRFANPGDEILGIISANPAVLGDNYECNWNGKYLTDEFGRILYDKVEEFIDIPKIDEETGETTVEKKSLGFFDRPRINPDYDPDQEYINRRNRAEWAMVGMLGKLLVRDDGTAQINGYVSAGENGIATASVEKTNIRVLSRINDHIVKVLLK